MTIKEAGQNIYKSGTVSIPPIGLDLFRVKNSSAIGSTSNSYDYNSAYSNALNEASFDKSLAFNSAEAQKSRDWSKMMSDTSYQRAVADLKAAGINPLLAVQGLSGASSGSAVSASSSPQSYGNDNSVTSTRVSGEYSLINTLIDSATDLITTIMNNSTSAKNAALKLLN